MMEVSYLHKKFKKKFVLYSEIEETKQNQVPNNSTKSSSNSDEGFSDDFTPNSAIGSLWSSSGEDTLNLSNLLSSSSSPSDVDYRRKSCSILQKNDCFFSTSKSSSILLPALAAAAAVAAITIPSTSSNSNSVAVTSCTSAVDVSISSVVSTSSNSIRGTEMVNAKNVCPFCNLNCSKPSVLQKHIRSHTNERPFPCGTCDFSFKTVSNLYKHFRSSSHVKRARHNEESSSSEHMFVKRRKHDETSVNFLYDNQNDVENSVKPYKPKFHNNKTNGIYDEDVPLNLSANKSNSSCEILKSNEYENSSVRKNSIKLNGGEVVMLSDEISIRKFDISDDKDIKSNNVCCRQSVDSETTDDNSMDDVVILSDNISNGSNRGYSSSNILKNDIVDFSQRAARLLIPKVKTKVPVSHKCSMVSVIRSLNSSPVTESSSYLTPKHHQVNQTSNLNNGSVCNSVNVLMSNKWVRYLPEIPLPVSVLDDNSSTQIIVTTTKSSNSQSSVLPESPLSPTIKKSEILLQEATTNTENVKYVRPISLQIGNNRCPFVPKTMISPETPSTIIQKNYCPQYLNGHYFSYLNFKNSTRSVYCTSNKTQPFYVEHIKKLSMYSEWRQQECKIDSIFCSGIDSNQRDRRFTMAGKVLPNILVHSSYKSHAPIYNRFDSASVSIKSDSGDQSDKSQNEFDIDCSSDDFVYIRGRGRGKYVCDMCGIRCKKPSILKKHIRTHSNDRPFTCLSCNYSFKTKGNLTKHMKSKAHSEKKCKEFDSSGNLLQNGNLSSTETDESDAESSDESTRIREQEAVDSLMSLSKSNKGSYSVNISEYPENDKEDIKLSENHIESTSKTYPVCNQKSLQPLHYNSMDAESKTFSDTLHPKLKMWKKFELNNQQQQQQQSVQNVPYQMVERMDSKKNQYNSESVIMRVNNDDGGENSSHRSNRNSAIQTLADVAAKQIELEKNYKAKNVATQYLKMATKSDMNESLQQNEHAQVQSSPQTTLNHLVKNTLEEDERNCPICCKFFIKPSQLRLHMNIHYLERPFRCETCAKRFRSKGHLQKHERSASHNSKLIISPSLSTSEPRPFKCSDCNIAFRIHGHLAKHLRSKMHIMKLECLSKIPFGLYTELERSNRLLTEINTVDSNLCLESLRSLAKKLFANDPVKLNQIASDSSNNDENMMSAEE